jgi:ribosome recycling factor
MMPPDFRSWSHENLAKLAEELYFEVRALRQDVKDAIKAYREVITENDFEAGRQLGMKQERALWELAASTQEIMK